MSENKPLVARLLLLAGFILLLAGLYGAMVVSPEEKELGQTIRIMYIHVPIAWIAMVAFFHVALGGAFYLKTRNMKWDTLARASAEVGLVFTTLALITGSIWGKSTWGLWWTWDPRLTSTLILWFIYLAYLMVRSYATEESQGARYAAVVSIIGFVDVPIIYLATYLWRTAHPPPVVKTGEMAPVFLWVLLISLAAFTALFFALTARSMSQKTLRREMEQLRQSTKGGGPNG